MNIVDYDNLNLISDFAIWRRSAEWSCQWWNDFYMPLIGAGYFLPPLIAYDILSAGERGERRQGRFISKRNSLANWGMFLDWANRTILGCLSHKALSDPCKRKKSALRFASVLSCRLVELVDVSALRKNGSFDPFDLFDREIESLKGNVDKVFEDCWKSLESLLAKSNFAEIIPLADSVYFADRNSDEVDPFICCFLRKPYMFFNFEEPPIRGSEPRADNPRKSISPTGEFSKRDLGTLPDDLGRLAPSELAILFRAYDGKQGGSKGTQRVRCKRLFLNRAIKGELWQNFSHSVRSSHMEPSVLVQIDFMDNLELHRFLDPPSPPVVSWYRALLVEVIHQYSKLAKVFRWAINFEVNHYLGRTLARAFIGADNIDDLNESNEKCFMLLAKTIPRAFSSRFYLKPGSSNNTEMPEEFDFWIRLVIGNNADLPEKEIKAQHVRASLDSGLRLERFRSGDVGLSHLDSAFGAHLLQVDCLKGKMEPVEATREIIASMLNNNEQELATCL